MENNSGNNFLLIASKLWNEDILSNLSKKFPEYHWILIDKKEDFNSQKLRQINPIKIFIPHWSHFISAEIFDQYECVVFHMTDLPYGRGGSPLQNLIVRGHKRTKISALKVEKELDAGDVYLKKECSLDGTAQEIFVRANKIIEGMIVEIIEEKLQPQPQLGEVVKFDRRTPEMSYIGNLASLDEIFDYIRMLDAEGYPKAYLENDRFRFEFSEAKKGNGDIIEANVRIIKK